MDITSPSPHHWAHRKFIEKDYENMRRNGMTAGLDGFTRVSGEKTELNLNTLLATFELFQKIIPKSFWKYYNPGIGNPEGLVYDNKLLTLSDLHCLLNAWHLFDYGIEHKKIVEIGGGFGCLAGQILEFWDCEYVMIDLEDSLKLQKYYLGELHPDKNVTYLTPNQPIPECDLVINIRSMMEMTPEQIKYYMGQINEKCEYFYCVNRYEKGPTRIKEYPFGDNWEILISSALAGQTHIHEFYLEKGRSRFTKMLATMPPWT